MFTVRAIADNKEVYSYIRCNKKCKRDRNLFASANTETSQETRFKQTLPPCTVPHSKSRFLLNYLYEDFLHLSSSHLSLDTIKLQLFNYSIFKVVIRENLIKTCEYGNCTAFRTEIDTTVAENVDFL